MDRNVFDDIRVLDTDVAIIPVEDPDQREQRQSDSPLYIPNPEDPDIPKDLKIPSEHKKKFDQGIVRNVGPNVSEDIYIGAHVFFPGYAGDEINLEDIGRLVIIPEIGIEFVLDEYDEMYSLLPRQSVLDQLDKVAQEMQTTGSLSPEAKTLAQKLRTRIENWDTKHMRL